MQEKAWSAFVDILDRSANLELLRDWEKNLLAAKRPMRRVQLLAEIVPRWQKRAETKSMALQVQETLVKAQLEQGKWSAALPQLREMLARPGGEAETSQRLRWLLAAGELALQDGNRTEARRAAQEAKPYLDQGGTLTEAFERLEKQAATKE